LKKTVILLVWIIVHQAHSQDRFDCSTLSLTSGDTVIMGRNHDGSNRHCLIVYNPAGLYKEGFESPGENTPKWTARFASLTFNVLGVGFTVLGMNEAGLAMGHMGFSECQYPAQDDRPMLDQILFITYMLDNCPNTATVIQMLDSVRISDESSTREHYFLCDRSGAMAIIEFIQGELVAYTNETMPQPLLSNDRYAKSLDYLKNYADFGGKQPIPERTFGVEEIMAIGCQRIAQYNQSRGDIVASAFSILNDIGFNKYPPPDSIEVDANYGTQFTVVFDLLNLCVFFRTRSNPHLREIDFHGLAGPCEKGIKILNMDESRKGFVNDLFTEYTLEKNRRYLSDFAAESKSLPKEIVEFLAAYPEAFRCR
jgi:penicillin V acylase-like amidase (Ntn superfamily)